MSNTSGDRETDTKLALTVIKRTELTSSSTGIAMVNSRNLETVVSQRQNFQLGGAGSWSREQIHGAFDVIALERMQDVTYVVRDPEKPRERGRNTPVTAMQIGTGTVVCKSHQNRCGKHCRTRFHGDR